MDKPLFIPVSKRWRGLGLTVFCEACKMNRSDVCKLSEEHLLKCPNGDQHHFKVYALIPGSGNKRKTKTLKTRDVTEAINEAIAFQKQVKENNFAVVSSQEQKKNNEEITKPYLLTHALARYVGFLNNEDVPEHRQRTRSKEYIKEVERSLMELAHCLKKNGHDLQTLAVTGLTEKMVGQVFKDLNEKKFAPRTFNKRLKHFTAFVEWLNEEYDYSIRNFFEKVNRRKTSTNPSIITQEEYEALLRCITPENGIQKYTNQKKEERNFYRPYLADGIRLALETGRRREEISRLKFSDIVHDNDGTPLYIRTPDYKVMRIQHMDESEKKFIYVPITDSLRKLIEQLGYQEHKHSDKYILAPDADIDRVKGMPDALSRGFGHYYKLLRTGRPISLKSLRKNYITALSLFMGGNAKAISGHSGDEVVERHYLNKEALAKAAQQFQVFPAEPKRKDSLENIRAAKQETKETTLEK